MSATREYNMKYIIMFIVLIGIIATLAALLVQKSQLQQLTAIWDSESLSFQLKYALG